MHTTFSCTYTPTQDTQSMLLSALRCVWNLSDAHMTHKEIPAYTEASFFFSSFFFSVQQQVEESMVYSYSAM